MPTLRPYQQDAKDSIYRAWQDGHRDVLYVCPTGGGKCLGRDTPVLMYNGEVKFVQNVRRGELLMGPDSKPRTVLSTCTGSEMLYRVTPAKGDPYVVNESHILSLKTTRYDNVPKGRVVNISVKDYLTKSKYWRHVHKGWRAGVDFEGVEVSTSDAALPPYMLGIWLGDGSSRGASVTTADDEIVEYLADYAIVTGQNLRMELLPDNASSTYHFSTGYDRSVIGLRKSLKELDLIQNKHIPRSFMVAPRAERLELLAGLLDSDGYLHHGYYEIVSKFDKLASDILFLARSLGFAAYSKLTEKTCTNTGSSGLYHRISISGDCSIIPTKLKRHQPEVRMQKKDVLVHGITVEPIGEGDYFGFEIDGDHLFMLGDFTVTHNTVTMASILHDHVGAACAIAHRQELVGQISVALAREGIHHNVLADRKVINLIRRKHRDETGKDFIQPMSSMVVAGVDTLIKRGDSLESWRKQVTLWVTDEAHHLLVKPMNKWGKGVGLFPNAKGLGVTATPIRADGYGLGREASGVFDTMVMGPQMRWLIDNGYLTDYTIYCPPTDFHIDDADLGKNGDFKRGKLRTASRESHIVGDVVDSYIRIAMSKRGVTFVTDVETAQSVAAEYNRRGVPAEAVDANTESTLRDAILTRFAKGELLQLVNVDLFGEGFDLPAIEVVSFARPTMSYALYVQQFGRSLRVMEGKALAIIIDHVGNVLRHGLPDKPREWSLLSRDKSPRTINPDDDIPLTYCSACTKPYEKFHKRCPYCGHFHEPEGRSRPDQVDGDLTELSADVLAMLRGQADSIEHTTPEDAAWAVRQDLIGKHAPTVAILGHSKRAANKQAAHIVAQRSIRESIAWWASTQTGVPEPELYRKFYILFGCDVLTAQTLPAEDMLSLAERINDYIVKVA